jgi:hypothetical protein
MPNQMASEITYGCKFIKEIDLTQKIFIESVRLISIRFIRNDLKLHLLNEAFAVSPQLKYSYVVGEVVLEKFVLVVNRNSQIYHIFPFHMSLP